jgi:hypothetical protein
MGEERGVGERKLGQDGCLQLVNVLREPLLDSARQVGQKMLRRVEVGRVGSELDAADSVVVQPGLT